MPKNYPDQLGLWVKQHVETQHEVNRAAFNAVREDILAALDAHYAMKTIWKNMHADKRISFGYDSFRRYVQQLKRETVQTVPKHLPAPATPAKPTQPTPGAPVSLPAKLPGFVLNPNPKKEELL